MKKFKVAILESTNGDVTISKTRNGRIVKDGEIIKPKRKTRKKTKIIVK